VTPYLACSVSITVYFSDFVSLRSRGGVIEENSLEERAFDVEDLGLLLTLGTKPQIGLVDLRFLTALAKGTNTADSKYSRIAKKADISWCRSQNQDNVVLYNCVHLY